jgi:hypothetical protein
MAALPTLSVNYAERSRNRRCICWQSAPTLKAFGLASLHGLESISDHHQGAAIGGCSHGGETCFTEEEPQARPNDETEPKR